ncbi:hypothetical protein ACFSY7_15225 [Kurthia populi]|uniref:Uncharacterized protein n=1 Tax=Kurthia populi TaxID=1562132 RepID=A0ABW5Y3E4_9BACL
MELSKVQKHQMLILLVSTIITAADDDETKLKYLTKEQCLKVLLSIDNATSNVSKEELESSFQSLVDYLYNDLMCDDEPLIKAEGSE